MHFMVMASNSSGLIYEVDEEVIYSQEPPYYIILIFFFFHTLIHEFFICVHFVIYIVANPYKRAQAFLKKPVHSH